MNAASFTLIAAKFGACTGPLVGVIGLVVILIIVFAIRKFNDSEKRKVRVKTPPIASWEYSEEEWRHYAGAYNLSESAHGPAKVRITPTDIWIDDDLDSVRLELKALRKFVAECVRNDTMLSIRVVWYRNSIKQGKTLSYFHHFRLPIPKDKKAEADKVIDYFNELIDERGERALRNE